MLIGEKLLLAIGCLTASLLLVNANAWGFTIEGPDIFGLDFRFNNPGARANGMGGAFIGLADDATAAYTNPAGLTVLTKPEVSVEHKWGKYTNPVNDYDATTPTLTKRVIEFDDSTSGLSFLSYVHPQEKVTFSIYRHQLINLKSDFEWGAKSNKELNVISMEVEANTLGFGAGYKLSNAFSVGLSVGFSEMTYDEYNNRTVPALDIDSYEIVSGRDNDVHYTASALWSPIESLSLGLVYRQGPVFTFRKLFYETLGVWVDRDGDDIGDFFATSDILKHNTVHEVKVPDVYGLGMAYRILPNLTAALDVNYIEYSDLIDSLIDGSGQPAYENFTIDDTYEVHIGLEYIIDLKITPLALRCGYYYRPEHRFHMREDSTVDPQLIPIFTEGEDDHIYSIGLGALLSDNVQIDVAGSVGNFVTEATASLVYRFE